MHTNTPYGELQFDREPARYVGEPIPFDCRPILEIAAERRRSSERREHPCPGCTYVSPVGWICRREQARRRGEQCAF